MAAPPYQPLLERLHAGDEPFVDLLVLVAVDRIVEKEREVVAQHQVVADAVCLNLVERRAGAMLPLEDTGHAMRVPSVGVVDSAEPVDLTRIDGALRRRLCGVPLAVVRHASEREAVDIVAAAVPYDPIELLVVVGIDPRPVVLRRLERHQQVTTAHLR